MVQLVNNCDDSNPLLQNDWILYSRRVVHNLHGMVVMAVITLQSCQSCILSVLNLFVP